MANVFFKNVMANHFFLMITEWENSVTLQSFTDVAGSHGIGAVFGTHWCYGECSQEWLGKNIAILESVYPVILSLFS